MSQRKIQARTILPMRKRCWFSACHWALEFLGWKVTPSSTGFKQNRQSKDKEAHQFQSAADAKAQEVSVRVGQWHDPQSRQADFVTDDESKQILTVSLVSFTLQAWMHSLKLMVTESLPSWVIVSWMQRWFTRHHGSFYFLWSVSKARGLMVHCGLSRNCLGQRW